MNLQELLRAIPDVEVLGHVQTAGVRGFVDADGSIVEAPLWLVCTSTRAWLAAAHGGELSAVAVPQTKVQRGWVTDTVTVGPWTVPLRRGTRAAAESLLAKHLALNPSGKSIESLAPTTLDERAGGARGTEIPDAVRQKLPAPVGDRWLLAVQTRSEQPFDRTDGSVERAPLWIAVSDRQAFLFAEGTTTFWFQPISHIADRKADGRILKGKRTDPELDLACLLAQVDTPERWRLLAHCRLEDGSARDATRLIGEGLSREIDTLWVLVARIFLALGDPERSLKAAIRALQIDPALDVDAAARSLQPARDRQRLQQGDVDRALAWALWRDHFPTDIEPVIPEGLPWPPCNPQGLWAAALGSTGRAHDALALTGQTSELERLQTTAALLAATQDPSAADAWALAAEAGHGLGDPRALELLERAITIEPTAHRHALAAAWSFDADDTDRAARHWQASVRLGSASIPLLAAAERAFAESVEATHPQEAAAAWARIARLAPNDEEAWSEAVQRSDDAILSAELQQAWCEHADTMEGPPQPRFPRWIRAAELAADAELDEHASAALHEAIRDDFLSIDALRQAIVIAAANDLEASLEWWQHLLATLEGGRSADGRSPATTLTADQLDALHPGGVGWLAQMRTSLANPEAPTRADLTRGLGRLNAGDSPEDHGAIARLCEALQYPVPDVFVFRGEGAYGCSAWSTEPPLLLLGVEHLRPGPRQLDERGRTFLMAVELVHLKCEHPILAFDADLVGTSRSIYQSFGSFAATAETVVDVVTLLPGVDQIAKLQTLFTLSRRVFATRSAVDKVGSVASPLLERLGLIADPGESSSGVGRGKLEGAALQLRLQADRAALLLTGDLQAAVHAIVASGNDEAPISVIANEGLLAYLNQNQDLRVTALMQFAAGLTAI